ncbi:MAG TPA: DNA polymerase, partial [Candidatus Saccharimonadales bacterium]|nr:DNA polymerase [Candidatus Saccharimonadales bacterium]
MTKRLAIIDGKSVFYRGYYSMPTLATKDGTPTGGVYGFTALSLEVIKKLKPDYVAVAWDKPKTNIRRRKELYPEYKAGRKPAPPDFYTQIPILHDLLTAFGWPLYEYDDYEADDIMGALAVKANQEGIEACLITSDLDMLQLVGPLTHVYIMKKGFTDIQMYNPVTFEEKYGLRVDQFLDLKSLKGDSSDNIPGVAGIGEKTAIQLLEQFGTLDNLYAHLDQVEKENLRKKLETGKDLAYLSKEIARIWVDAPVPLDLEGMDVTKFDKPKLKKLLTELEFRSLIRQLGTQLDETEEVVAAEAPAIPPTTVKPYSDSAKPHLVMAEKLVVARCGDNWLVSHNPDIAYSLTAIEAQKLLGSSRIVAHDAKVLLKELIGQGATKLPEIEHDTRIANFLLNSLDRNRELSEISGIDLSKDEDGGLSVATIWHLYVDQAKRLKATPKLEKLAREIEFPTISLLAKVEMRGVLLDSKLLADMSKKFEADIRAIEQNIYGYVDYEFNIGSPTQLADVLYGKLQLPTVGIKKGKTGFSTGASELDKLRGTHPIIDQITKYREYTKLKNTYIDSLPKLVDGEGKLHTTYALDVAATGRLSSHDPNLQNIPIRSELGRAIRGAFVPSKGNVFVGADYSQFELRLAAVLA